MQEAMSKIKVLFLCTGNSCRSQMAEGWARALRGDRIEAYSAGIETHGLNPNAVKVMAEAGVDISAQKSQHIDEFRDLKLDYVVTVCGHAHETCPYFPAGCEVKHVGFEDPPKMAKELAAKGASEEEQLECYRAVRDKIREFVETLPESLPDIPADDTVSLIREKYGETAKRGLSTANTAVKTVAKAFGYSEEELSSIPQEANMGLSCGNPVAMASLQEGEVVVDLGSGGGLDVFLAAKKVGPAGSAIGIDMTPEMIELAKRNAQNNVGGNGGSNVEFKLGTIDALPLEDETADVVISNCVINLAPDKDAVFREVFRVLKPGGRVAVSDIALKKGLPEELARSVAALIGCISGAIEIDDYVKKMKQAGFDGVTVVDSNADLNVYATGGEQNGCCVAPANEKNEGAACCQPNKTAYEDLEGLFQRYDVNEYAASVKIFAVKPV